MNPKSPPVAAPEPGGLHGAVRSAVAQLRQLAERGGGVLEETDRAHLRSVAEAAEGRLGRNVLQVALVGERKSGRSSFLNALLGVPLLGVAVREHTGTITIVELSKEPDYEAVFLNGSRERWSERHPDPRPALAREDQAISGELAAVREEAGEVGREEGRRGEALGRLQSDLLGLLSARGESERGLQEAARRLEVVRKERELSAGQLERARLALPAVLRSTPRGFWERLWAAFVRPFHRSHLRRVAERDERDSESAGRLSAAEGAVEAAEGALGDLQQRIGLAEERVQEARRAHGEALRARETLQERLHRLAARRSMHRQRVESLEKARTEAFFQRVAALTDARREGPQVSRLHLRYPGARLPADLRIIDTPGLDATDPLARARAWDAVGELADVCLVLSDLRQAIPLSLLHEARRLGVPQLGLLLTRADLALEDAGGDAAELEEAVRSAAGRFAEQLGLRRDRLLCLSVASPRVLAGEPADAHWVRAFEQEFGEIVEILRRQRGLAIAARAAVDLGRVQRLLQERGTAAERALHFRLQALEAARLPSPEAYVEEAVSARLAQFPLWEAQIREEAELALEGRLSALRGEIGRMLGEVPEKMLQAQLTEALKVGLGRAVEEAVAAGEARLRGLLVGAGSELEAELAQRLRVAARGAPPQFAGALSDTTSLSPVFSGGAEEALAVVLAESGRKRLQVGLGGAAAGLALGVLLTGGLALPALLAAGAATAASRWWGSADRLRKELETASEQAIERARPTMAQTLAAALPQQERLHAELHRYFSMIVEAQAGWLERRAAEEGARREHLYAALQAIGRDLAGLAETSGALERGLRAAAGSAMGLVLPTLSGPAEETRSDGQIDERPPELGPELGALAWAIPSRTRA